MAGHCPQGASDQKQGPRASSISSVWHGMQTAGHHPKSSLRPCIWTSSTGCSYAHRGLGITSLVGLSCVHGSRSSNTTEPAFPFTILYGFLHSCCSHKLIPYALDFQGFLSNDCHFYLFVNSISNLFLFCIISVTQWFVWDGCKTDACAQAAFLM